MYVKHLRRELGCEAMAVRAVIQHPNNNTENRVSSSTENAGITEK
jgi:hypothetical protein